MHKILIVALLALALPVHAFDLQGHRGARGLMPENTLPAFERAAEIGVATLELDVGITKDGAVIVAHDRRLNPEITRDAQGRWIATPGPRIRDLTFAELKAFDVGGIKPDTAYARQFSSQTPVPGTSMPLLAAVAALPGRFNIETKISPLAPDDTLDPEAFARILIAEIRRLDIASRTTIQSFDWRTLSVVAREAPDIARAYLTIERGANETIFKGKGVSPWTGIDAGQHANSTPRVVKAAGGAIWSPFWRDLSPEIVAEAKALGLAIIPWTVNEAADVARLIDMGVDGLITDYPDRAKALLDTRGIAVR
jgi:glycerophosphoryl diester phosphodiesterase